MPRHLLKAPIELEDVTGYRWKDGLLGPDEPDPVGHVCSTGLSPFLLLCDHAGRLIPKSLGSLGVSPADLARHIAYDIGALGVSRRVSERLDAELIYQRYSRLVVDCNRPPHNPTAFITTTDGTTIPGNLNLTVPAAAMRLSEIFYPYQARIEHVVRTRLAAKRPTVILTVHSFTPWHTDYPTPRPWHLGLLFNEDRRLADALAEEFKIAGDLHIGFNQPYALENESDYAIPVYAEHRGLPGIELEIRQDMIAEPADQINWGDRLADALRAALRRIAPELV
ncbi:N-formylglutamate amidohydrolase [Mesorhizobium australicum]|uniref:N-formylglutamate amidohydrolase n=1 Tax=Mesorhizobium australicum TaxID=536018 RepID=A0ACC6T6X3_9HYPH